LPEVPEVILQNSMFQIKTKVIKNIEVAPKCYKIGLFCPRLAKKVVPGQFVMLRVNSGPEVLLRRPFSIHAVSGKNIEILYEAVGKATEVLSRKKAGEYLDAIGPLGNGFSVLGSRLSVLVAGGMGIAPLFFLAQALAKRKSKILPNRQAGQNPNSLVLIGARTKRQILCEKEFRNLGYEVKIATDDGSKGFKGKVTGLLNNLLSTMNYQPSTIYACGPKLMLKEITRISKKYNIPAQISLEEHMACGIGACLGCVVKTQSAKRKAQNAFEYKRVCKDGPVFNANKIIWQ